MLLIYKMFQTFCIIDALAITSISQSSLLCICTPIQRMCHTSNNPWRRSEIRDVSKDYQWSWMSWTRRVHGDVSHIWKSAATPCQHVLKAVQPPHRHLSYMYDPFDWQKFMSNTISIRAVLTCIDGTLQLLNWRSSCICIGQYESEIGQ